MCTIIEDQPSLAILGDPGYAPLAYWEDISWQDLYRPRTFSIKDVEYLKEVEADSINALPAPYLVASELASNYYSVELWCLLFRASKFASLENRYDLYERAVAILPRSYKIWHLYLQERLVNIPDNLPPKSPIYEKINQCFERCLVQLSQCPKIWFLYLDFLQSQRIATRVRRTFDRALQALPITQHYRVWPLYLQFVDRVELPTQSIAVYKRYCLFEPTKINLLVDKLKKFKKYDEAAVILVNTLSGNTVTVEGRTNHDLWLELCELITKNPADIHNVEIEKVLRSGLRNFTTEVASLWCGLANYYVYFGHFDKARDIYEEALEKIATVYDFGVVFDTYAKFLEAILQKLMDSSNVDPIEIDINLARLESLIKRRPFLLSSVKLRHNPNNVTEWLNRVQLYENDTDNQIKTFTEALVTVDPSQAVGKISSLWIKFANLYEAHNDLEECRAVYEKAIKAKYKNQEELVKIWCSYAEFELVQKCYKQALEVARRSVQKPSLISQTDGEKYFQKYMFRSTRLWALCLDLEECLGTPMTLKACINKMLDLKVITPSQLLNYADYLEEKGQWEEAFATYEKGISIFRWPYLYDIWIPYLSKFVSKYKAKKLERARELFEQAIHEAPPHLSRRIYLLYARLEEEFGLSRRALAVYSKAADVMKDSKDVYEIYLIFIAKALEFTGAASTREVYDKAIDRLSDTDDGIPFAIKVGMQYANMERNLGEIDRARAILQHISQFCDPRKFPDFWQKWSDFEVAHGNEELFRELLRTKRSVQAIYAQSSVIDLIDASKEANKQPNKS